MQRKVKMKASKRFAEKCHSRENEGMFDTRKWLFFNTVKDFETKIGCTLCRNCAVFVAKRSFFDEKSGLVSSKKRLRVKKSSVRFFHAEPGFSFAAFTFSSNEHLTVKLSVRYAKTEI